MNRLLFVLILSHETEYESDKSGTCSDVNNYRPIFILSRISKTVESLVLDGIMSLLNPILPDEQHGFCSGHSTVSCLVTTLNL